MVSFNLSLQINKRKTSIAPAFILWHLVTIENFESSFNHLNDTVLHVKTAI